MFFIYSVEDLYGNDGAFYTGLIEAENEESAIKFIEIEASEMNFMDPMIEIW